MNLASPAQIAYQYMNKRINLQYTILNIYFNKICLKNNNLIINYDQNSHTFMVNMC